jgi:hypothetical protein
VYQLPWWGLQVSGALQSVPGPEISASTYPATNAQIAPSLGRNLSSGANGTVTLPMMQPGTVYGDPTNKLDVAFTKSVHIRQVRVEGGLDIFNVTNAYAAQLVNLAYGPNWLTPTQGLGARVFRVAAKLNF